MEQDFWHRRWQKNEIGFHLNTVNPLLVRYWPRLALEPGARVLVPLCGKSHDLRWLAGQGHAVLGVELSEIAVRDCFAEAGMSAVVETDGPFQRHHQHALAILQGDFFQLDRTVLGQVDCVYDRAALIALPADMRSRYVSHLRQLLPAGTPILLVTLEYDQALMNGPPFAVSEAEVRALYQGADVELWLRSEVLADNPRFAARGLSYLNECVYRVIV